MKMKEKIFTPESPVVPDHIMNSVHDILLGVGLFETTMLSLNGTCDTVEKCDVLQDIT